MEALIEAVDDWGITDVVMASHGRTGLARVILGSVADELIQRLHLPIIVIPALAAQAMHDEQVREEQRVRE
jgi:nucleotide-binding universal stress UspA family protein